MPSGTKQFAVVCEDFGAGNPPPFVHWVLYNIPGTARALPENLPLDPTAPLPAEIAGAVAGGNGFQRRRFYRGPAPGPGTIHRYHFVVYALDADLRLKPGLNRDELHEAMHGHILGQGEMVPWYRRENRPVLPGF